LFLVALPCCSTFEVEERHIHRLLASADDLSIAAKAQTIVCDSAPGEKENLPSLIPQSLIRHFKIAHKLEPHLYQLLPSHGADLNSAIYRIKNGVSLGCKWTISSMASPS